MKSFQDQYPKNVSHGHGCGNLNTHGHQIKTVWDGDDTVTRFRPEQFHTSYPGTETRNMTEAMHSGSSWKFAAR